MHCSVIYGDVFARHDMELHPEGGSRLRLVLSGVPYDVKWHAPVRASVSDLSGSTARNTSGGYGGRAGNLFLDPNTYVTSHSFDAAPYAAGSTS